MIIDFKTREEKPEPIVRIMELEELVAELKWQLLQAERPRRWWRCW